MHIPDGFLDLKTAAATTALAAGGFALATRQLRRRLPRRRVPLLGVAAAFVFAAQMVNFPVVGGTSGHLIGATLAAVLLGPSAAIMVLTAVLIVQCFLFADGGVTALGANVFNMAIVGSLSSFVIVRGVRWWFPGPRGLVLAAGFAGWCATLLAAIVCAGELALSGTVAWAAAFPAMAGVHMLIGVGEAASTALVVAAIQRVRPELLAADRSPARNFGAGPAIGFGVLIALGLALFVAPFACPWPDGLERVAASLGFEHHATAPPPASAPLAGYQLPGIAPVVVATALAGAIGTIIVFGLAFVLARVLVPKTATESL